jgi:7-keto-8-aminopelargonate synthetase-like enzyme
MRAFYISHSRLSRRISLGARGLAAGWRGAVKRGLKHFILRALGPALPYINPIMSAPQPLQQLDRTYVRVQKRKLSYFAGCDYFRLASHPQILEAMQEGLAKYGLNVSASRLTTGNHELYELLEARLAEFFGTEAAVLAANGYMPNLMVAQALAGQFSHALIDERAHGCLFDAAQLLDCPVLRFKHRDPNDLARILRRLGRVKPLLLTDGMFSHDGSLAPLKHYLAHLPARGLVLLDDAHGAGVLGPTGRGTPEHAAVSDDRIIQTITLSKAFGVYGGAVLGPRELKRIIIEKSRIYMGNTPLPLPLANAALKSLELVKKDKSLRKRLARNTNHIKAALRTAGFPLGDFPGPIIPLVPKNRNTASRLKRRLLAEGIHPPFIKYPGGPEGGYFRFVISSEHTQNQLDALLKALLA